MRYLVVVLLLAGCAASKWTREGSTNADLDKDYRECVEEVNQHAITSVVFGAFGLVGVFAGNSVKDEKIRDCLEGRGWQRGDAVARRGG